MDDVLTMRENDILNLEDKVKELLEEIEGKNGKISQLRTNLSEARKTIDNERTLFENERKIFTRLPKSPNEQKSVNKSG
jgi:predicted  nucleic acid-binding Zn-ribbon protein